MLPSKIQPISRLLLSSKSHTSYISPLIQLVIYYKIWKCQVRCGIRRIKLARGCEQTQPPAIGSSHLTFNSVIHILVSYYTRVHTPRRPHFKQDTPTTYSKTLLKALENSYNSLLYSSFCLCLVGALKIDHTIQQLKAVMMI